MCLAVPGKVLECEGDAALVDLQGNRLQVSRVLTPEVEPGGWVLVHAGFAISSIDEEEAMETWEYLKQLSVSEVDEAAGIDAKQGGEA